MIACDSYLSLFFFTLQKKMRSGAIVRFSDNSSYNMVLDITLIHVGPQIASLEYFCYNFMSIHFTLD